MWVYGYKNVCKDLKLMLGGEPSIFWKVTWVGIAPVFLCVIFIIGIASWGEHKYAQVIPYPEWATAIGWALVAVSAVQIPLWAVLMTLYYLFKGRVSDVIKPTSRWGPGDKAVRRAILDEQAGIARTNKYSYDNEAMGYHM